MALRRATLALVALAALLEARSARANDPVAIGPPRAVLRVGSSADGAIEERRDGEADWRELCRLPCDTQVDSSAEHRLVMRGEGPVAVLDPVRSGEATELDVSPAHRGASTAVTVVGGVVVTAGVAVAIGGLVEWFNHWSFWPRSCDPEACAETEADRLDARRQSAGTTFMLAGLGVAVVGGLVVLVGALAIPKTTHVTRVKSEGQPKQHSSFKLAGPLLLTF